MGIQDPSTWRDMYDSTNPHDIPKSAVAVAGYVLPSPYAWTDADWNMFPSAAHVRITVAGAEPSAHGAPVVDVERGAFTPAQAREFVIARNSWRPHSATVYCNGSTLQNIISACRGLSYHVWLANWLGRKPLASEAFAIQNRLPSGVTLVAWQFESINPYDESVIFDEEWHPTPK